MFLEADVEKDPLSPLREGAAFWRGLLEFR
jgi:hypothetical protein